MKARVIDLFFPRCCPGCQTPLLPQESNICVDCQMNMAFNDFHDRPDNPVMQLFWGRLYVESATALLSFVKQGRAQAMIHALKYHGNLEVGKYLGGMLGARIKPIPRYQSIDLLVPVPIHPRKLQIRGYNQTVPIAEGLAETLGKPVAEEVVVREKHRESQTRLGRIQRWQNVESVFEVGKGDRVAGKHVALVDDVVTTGATIEAVGGALLRAGASKISVLALAKAGN